MVDILELGPTTVETAGGQVRHRSELRFQHDKLPPASISFEVDEQWSGLVDHSAAVLVPAALVLAARLGDDLRVSTPIDEDAQAAARRAIALQSRWFGWRLPDLVAPYGVPRRRRPKRGHGLFFTRGIDSWGSYLALRAGPKGEHPTHLLLIDGDAHLDDHVRAGTVAGTRAAADQLGLPLIVVRSDLRATFDPHTRWDYDLHGPVLAGTGYLLRNGLGRVTIAATNAWPDAIPYGSHPALDPLWSTPHLRVVHHLPDERRWQRAARVAADPVARTNLDVCWEARQVGNCGRCQKCLMTMMSLELSGHHGWEECFDAPWDPDNIRHVGHVNPTPTLICIEHCDAVGLRADPIRQRWEAVEPSAGFPYRYRSLPSGPRVPVRTRTGGRADPALALAVGRLLAPLGCRVDHFGRGADGLVAELVDGTVHLTDADGRTSLATEAADLAAALAALGVVPDPAAAFDPDGHRWPDEAWTRARRRDPTDLSDPTAAGS